MSSKTNTITHKNPTKQTNPKPKPQQKAKAKAKLTNTNTNPNPKPKVAKPRKLNCVQEPLLLVYENSDEEEEQTIQMGDIELKDIETLDIVMQLYFPSSEEEE